MDFFAKILDKVAESSVSAFTPWVVFDEPECPEELI